MDLYAGMATYVGSVTITRNVKVFVPVSDVALEDSFATPKGRILDSNILSTQDNESEDCGPFWFNGYVKIPSLIEQAQGNGTWSYVQLVARSYSFDLTQYSSPRGLDNCYPYPYSYLTDHQTQAMWVTTSGNGRLVFHDRPGLGIGGQTFFTDGFFADLYAVLRPPVYPGQTYVELPTLKNEWRYSAASSRNNWSLKWQDESSYQQDSSGWIADPGTEITVSFPQKPVASQDMDWNSVVTNAP